LKWQSIDDKTIETVGKKLTIIGKVRNWQLIFMCSVFANKLEIIPKFFVAFYVPTLIKNLFYKNYVYLLYVYILIYQFYQQI